MFNPQLAMEQPISNSSLSSALKQDGETMFWTTLGLRSPAHSNIGQFYYVQTTATNTATYQQLSSVIGSQTDRICSSSLLQMWYMICEYNVKNRILVNNQLHTKCVGICVLTVASPETGLHSTAFTNQNRQGRIQRFQIWVIPLNKFPAESSRSVLLVF